MKVASPIVAPSNRDTAELPPLGEGINAYPASLRARTMGMSKADRQKHFDAYDAKKKGEEKKVSEGVVKKDYIGPLYAAWQDVIAGNPNTAAKMEETEDSLRDRRMERGGVDGNTRYDRAPKPANTAGKKKPYDGMSAVDKVKADITAKYGKGAIMNTKKK